MPSTVRSVFLRQVARLARRGGSVRSPFAFVADQRVRRDDRLTHDGDNGDLRGLAGGTEGFVFLLEWGVEPDSHESGPINSLPKSSPAACFASMVPSSGMSISKAIAVAGPIPGMLNSISSRARSAGQRSRMLFHA